MTNVDEAACLAAAGVLHSHLLATAIAFLWHVQGLEVEEYSDVVPPLLAREDGAVHAVRDGCQKQASPMERLPITAFGGGLVPGPPLVNIRLSEVPALAGTVHSIRDVRFVPHLVQRALSREHPLHQVVATVARRVVELLGHRHGVANSQPSPFDAERQLLAEFVGDVGLLDAQKCREQLSPEHALQWLHEMGNVRSSPAQILPLILEANGVPCIHRLRVLDGQLGQGAHC